MLRFTSMLLICGLATLPPVIAADLPEVSLAEYFHITATNSITIQAFSLASGNATSNISSKTLSQDECKIFLDLLRQISAKGNKFKDFDPSKTQTTIVIIRDYTSRQTHTLYFYHGSLQSPIDSSFGLSYTLESKLFALCKTDT